MMTLLELAAICPTTTAKVERGFSLMNLLCTLLRSSMLPKTLEYLTRICLAQDPSEEKHKSGLSSTDISIKKAAQDDIDESVKKYLDRN